MIKRDKQNRVNVRVRPGSALDRYLAKSTTRTATEAMHELATAHETMVEERAK